MNAPVRLHHVQVMVPVGGTDAVVPFYEAIGLVRVPKPAQGVAREGAWLDFPGGTQQLHVSEREGAAPGSSEQHFAVSVGDLDALVGALQDAGHPWKPGPDVLGARRGMTADPQGNPVELIEAVGPFA